MAAASLLAACQSHAGLVVDAATGRPIAGAVVAAARGDASVVTAVTGGDGRYSLEAGGSPADRHVVTFSAPGYLSQTLPALADTSSERDAALQRDPAPADSDGDRLSDGEEARAGTNPAEPDTDADGLPDGVEAKVIAPFGAPGLGVTPLRKDLLLEVDWAATSAAARPSPVESQVMAASFGAAPLRNPDGSTGIHLVFDAGEYGGGGPLPLPSTWDCATSLEAPPSPVVDGLAPGRRPYFFHAVSVGSFNCALFGYAQLPGRRLVYAGDQSKFGPLAPFVVAGVLQHELGHNLGLRHGGDVDTGCKPNYPSVMNYNPLLGLGLDYSRGGRPPLDEAALDERVGLGNGPVDWDHDGQIDAAPVRADVNNFEAFGLVGELLSKFFTAGRCPRDGIIEELRDFDDWHGLDLRAPVPGSGAAQPDYRDPLPTAVRLTR